jgi:ribonuclease HII
VDGTYWKPWYNAEGELIPALTLTKGDSRSLPIAAASIIAKDAHDEWVRDEVARRPELDERYGFSSNVGYGAPVHLAGLKEWGADVLHRKSFAPVCDGSKKKMTRPLFRT